MALALVLSPPPACCAESSNCAAQPASTRRSVNDVARRQRAYRSYQRASNFYEQVASRIRGLPGVTAVGFGGELPLELGDWCTSAVIDVPGPSGERSDCVQMMQVTPGYFEALRIPLRGRAPNWSETNNAGVGAVVSSAFADRFWPNGEAIGRGVKCCNGKPPFYTITGVTGAVRTHGVDRPPGQVVYFPMIPFATNPGIEGVPTFMRRAGDGAHGYHADDPTHRERDRSGRCR